MSAIIFNGSNAKLLTKGNLLNGDGTTYARGLSVVYQTASATAAAFTNYLCNTTSAAFTMTLPNGAAGSVIRFTDDAGTWATNNLTIAPAAAQTIQGISASGSLVCNLSGAYVELSWDATNSYWVVQASGFQYGPTYSPGVTGGIIPSSGLPSGAQALSGITFGGGGSQTTLNWYEEGTWTPAVNSSATTGTVTYSVQSGYFTRVGRVVYYTFDVVLASYNGAGSGNLLISGLPYASHNDANMSQASTILAAGLTSSASYTQFTGLMTNNATTLRVIQQILSTTPASTTTNNVLYAGMNSSATVAGSGFYFI